jgi:hypothetical protein
MGASAIPHVPKSRLKFLQMRVVSKDPGIEGDMQFYYSDTGEIVKAPHEPGYIPAPDEPEAPKPPADAGMRNPEK